MDDYDDYGDTYAFLFGKDLDQDLNLDEDEEEFGPRISRRPLRPLHEYSVTEKTLIEEHCRKAGKVSPWEYVRIQEEKRAAGIESKAEYRERKLAEPAKKEEKVLAAEIPKPKKLNHQQKMSLQKQRMEAGLTQKEAAAQINVRIVDIQSWEKGETTPGPKMSKLKLVYARALKNKK